MTTPKKSLGQNFLRDEKVLRKIIDAADLQADDFVIEVGPGEGVLTEKLAEQAKKVLAMEIDSRLVESLQKKFSNKKEKVEIAEGDILKLNLKNVLEVNQKIYCCTKKCRPAKYKVVANIPYYITSPIIRLFLESDFPPAEMILMVQKEVAKRITAKPGQMSLLALSAQYYARAELLFIVDRKSFYPAPEVDSAVIKISKIIRRGGQISKIDSRNFFRLARAGFSAKRKTLLNNISSSLRLEKTKVEEKLKAAGLKPTARAQELSVEDWERLATLFKDTKSTVAQKAKFTRTQSQP